MNESVNMPFRPDRFLTLYFFGPISHLSKPKGGRIPILMYHSISDDPEAGYPYYWINTSPRRFAEHMRFLSDNQYKIISFSDAAGMIGSSGAAQESITSSFHPAVEARYVVLTFDDGYQDFYTEAFPILKRYGFTATVFLPTGFIAEETLLFKGKKCLRWGEVCELASSGVQFGSHTVNHSELRNLTWDKVEYEVRKSKEVLEDRVGLAMDSFSYPYAFPEEDRRFTTRFRNLLMESGYANGATTIIGTARKGNDRLFLKRIPTNSNDDLVLLQAKLDGGYDWVKEIQYGFKLIKRVTK